MPSPILLTGGSFDEAIPAINQNFNDAIQSIRDLGADTSTTLTITATVAAGGLYSAVVTLTSPGVSSSSVNQVFAQRPTEAVSGLSPLLDIYVDNDNDANYRLPLGASLSSGQKNLFPNATCLNTSFQNSIGAYLLQVVNRDSSSHTYYLHSACGYFPLPPVGVFQ